MPQHYSKRIGRPFRKVIESEPAGGGKRILYLECAHIAERYMAPCHSPEGALHEMPTAEKLGS